MQPLTHGDVRRPQRMRQIALHYPGRCLHVDHGHRERVYQNVSTASLLRFWRVINEMHESFVVTHVNINQGTYRFCEIVYIDRGSS